MSVHGIRLRAKISLLLVLLVPSSLVILQAQEVDPSAGNEQPLSQGVPGASAPEESFFTQGRTPVQNSFWRFSFYEVTAQRFSGDHPFYQLTNNLLFKEGRTSANSTLDNTGFLIGGYDPITGERNHDKDQSAWIRFAHGVPPFSLEYVIPNSSSLIPAIGFEFYYTNTWLTDNTAAIDKTRQSDTPIVHLRAHYYMSSVTARILSPPGKGGVELFYGGGVAQIESTLKWGFRRAGLPADLRSTLTTRIVTDVARSNAPDLVVFQKVGVATSGDNFGVGLALYLFGANPVVKNPFYHNRYAIDFPDQKFVSLGGLIMRVSFMYSFWD